MIRLRIEPMRFRTRFWSICASTRCRSRPFWRTASGSRVR